MLFANYVQVDLTAYVEKHEFIFDAVLDENVSNELEVAVCATRLNPVEL